MEGKIFKINVYITYVICIFLHSIFSFKILLAYYLVVQLACLYKYGYTVFVLFFIFGLNKLAIKERTSRKKGLYRIAVFNHIIGQHVAKILRNSTKIRRTKQKITIRNKSFFCKAINKQFEDQSFHRKNQLFAENLAIMFKISSLVF